MAINNEQMRHWTMDAGLLAMRAMVGVVFFFHGSQKLFAWFGGPGMHGTADFMATMGIPLPHVSAVLVGATEFFGGLALLVGLATRLVTVPMIFSMLVAVFVVHRHAFSAQQGGMEYPLTLAVVLFGLGLTGAGRFSVTALLPGRERVGLASAAETNTPRAS